MPVHETNCTTEYHIENFPTKLKNPTCNQASKITNKNTKIRQIPSMLAASVSSESNLPANLLRSLLFGDVSESRDVSSLVLSRALLLFRRFLINLNRPISLPNYNNGGKIIHRDYLGNSDGTVVAGRKL